MAENVQSQAEKCRALGSKNFQNGNYSRALELYSKGLEHEPQNVILLSNRAATYLALGKPEGALEDTERGLKIDPNSVKLVFRRAKSLVGLKRYAEAVTFLESQSRLFSESKELTVLLDKAKWFDVESTEGKYPYVKLYEELKSDPLLDHAEYVAHNFMMVSESGRVVAKTDIPAGTLLLAQKALGYSKSINSIPPRADNVRLYGAMNTELMASVAEKLRQDLEITKLFFKLKSSASSNFNPESPIDIDRMREIILSNCVIVPRDASNTDNAFWLLPSLFQHSCTDANCLKQLIGDFCFVRSIKHISRGESLTLSRFPLVANFENRSETLRKMGLDCECSLCKIQSSFLANVRDQLAEITLESDKLRSEFTTAPPNQLDELVQKLDMLHDRAVDIPGIDRDFNLLAHKIAHLLGIGYRLIGKFNFAANIFEENAKFFERFGCLEEALDAMNVLLFCYTQLGDEAKGQRCMEKGFQLARLVVGDEKAVDAYFARQREIVNNSTSYDAALHCSYVNSLIKN